jgi:hypothetical protein
MSRFALLRWCAWGCVMDQTPAINVGPAGLRDLQWQCLSCWRAFDGVTVPLTRHPQNGEPCCTDCLCKEAAFDLLAACKLALPLIEALHEVPPARASQMRAAIAKAEGRKE